jgi:dTDP-4-amino-4,6-dideoxygalactose transaminase
MNALYFDWNTQRDERCEEIHAALGCWRGVFPHSARACDRVVNLPWFPKMRREHVEGVAA